MTVVIEQRLLDRTIGQHSGQTQEHRLSTDQGCQMLRVLRGEMLQGRWSGVAHHLDHVFGVGLTQWLQVPHRFGESATP
jgi:hypothetical protein